MRIRRAIGKENNILDWSQCEHLGGIFEIRVVSIEIDPGMKAEPVMLHT